MKKWKWALPLIAGFHAIDASAGWLDEVGLELRFDNNLTRGQLVQDIKSDTALIVSVAPGTGYQVTDNSRLSLTLALSGSAYQHYHQLNNVNAGLELAYRWKFGLGPYVPELAISSSVTRLEYQDAMRDGWLYSGQIGLSKRLSDRAGIRMAYQVEQRKSDTVGSRLLPTFAADVFDLKSHSLTFGGDFSPSPGYIISAAYSLRDGDIVPTTLLNLPYLDTATGLAADSVFGPGRFAYKMHAKTHGVSLGLTRIIGGNASLSVGYQRLDSRADSGVDYKSNLARVNYLYQY